MFFSFICNMYFKIIQEVQILGSILKTSCFPNTGVAGWIVQPKACQFNCISKCLFVPLLNFPGVEKCLQKVVYPLCVFSCPGSSIPDLGQWVSDSVTHWLTATFLPQFWHKRVTFETWDLLVFWSVWCPDKKTKRQKRQKDKKQKDKGQRPKREFNIVMSGQFRTLAMFFSCPGSSIPDLGESVTQWPPL